MEQWNGFQGMLLQLGVLQLFDVYASLHPIDGLEAVCFRAVHLSVRVCILWPVCRRFLVYFHDRAGTVLFWCKRQWRNSNGVTPMECQDGQVVRISDLR